MDPLLSNLVAPVAPTIAVRCVAHIVAARLAALERVLGGRNDGLAAPASQKLAGRRRDLADFRVWLRALGALSKDPGDPTRIPLEAVSPDMLGRLCALAAGDAGQRRLVRESNPTGTALLILEILESRS